MKYLATIFLLFVFFISCRKDSFITDSNARIGTSTDTLFFDTVFTRVGSVTKFVKIFNNNDQKLRLKQIRLAGGATSPFKLNIDGVAATESSNLVIEAKDSLYIFVQVTVNPNAQNLPFVQEDSIIISYNETSQSIQLRAYGQNAIFLKNEIITENTNWTARLPYVIMSGVTVGTNATLTLSAGTRVFLHADAPFIVDGTLRAEGTNENRVIFSGDRLDQDYKNLPSAWPGIFFRSSSKGNKLDFVVVKNAYQGIIAQNVSSAGGIQLTLSHSIIDNIFDAGLLAVNTKIRADNCLISNCGSNVVLQYGGDYEFWHCTIATYGNKYIDHKNAVLQIGNYVEKDGSSISRPLKALFVNSIIWGENGNVSDEIVISRKGLDVFDVKFDHVLYKASAPVSNATFTSSIKDVPPMFDSVNTTKPFFDFRITKHHSPAIDAGIPSAFPQDLDGKHRDSKPDLGCYER